ncbi:MAG: hypothetical protein JXC85_06470 [Candidatus Aenigmarchaeota archaeon]|nr:hypothetical protein [Candidatus Aenigmarchaeota archaeon]
MNEDDSFYFEHDQYVYIGPGRKIPDKRPERVFDECHHVDFGPRGANVSYDDGGPCEFYPEGTEVYRYLKKMCFQPVASPVRVPEPSSWRFTI